VRYQIFYITLHS